MSMAPFPHTVLVTGVGGFVGQHVVNCLRETNSEIRIVGLDRIKSENTAVDHCLSIDLSPENRQSIAKAILEYDIGAIVHCAGSANSDSESLSRDNLQATTVLIDAASYGRRGLPFCHIGSSAEYMPLKKPEKTTEKTLTEPVGEYGKVKLQTTKAVLQASYQGDISGYVLRLFNPIGIGMPETNLVGRVCKFLRKEQDQCLRLGNLDSYRDYIDIRDVARAIVLSLKQGNHLIGLTINIGTGIAQCTRDLVNELLHYSNRPVFLEEKNAGSYRSETVHWQEADISRAIQSLGWKPKIKFKQTIEYIVLNNPG